MFSKIDISHLATKADLSHLATKAELHKELHAQTWRFLTLLVTLMTAQTGLILAAMHYMLSHSK